MDVWQIVLYGVAGLLAIRSLTALMSAHRDRLLAEHALREEQERRAAKKKSKPHSPAEAAPRRAT